MDRLGSLLVRVIQRQPGSQLVFASRARQIFLELLGPALAAEVDAIDQRNGILFVVTRNPSLAHQLRLDTPTLLQRLNDLLEGSKKVRAVKVQTGGRTRP
ncbi:MAG TPA: DUF721 domain-containing protein [Candidatus Acidoferrales bacterium]|nr:DUF721 domain-containing protein [Candidatus Acidoferrales bacterium]